MAAGDGLVVGVSGGVDSVVLLHLLHRISQDLDLHLHVAHLDHQLRDVSAAEARFVADLTRGLGWPVTTESVPVADLARGTGVSLEQAGRRARYEFFERIRRDTESRWIAVGHHADDQAETVLLRLLRGAGGTGLSAMSAVRADGLLRPLLNCRGVAICDYARRHALEHCEDASNRDLDVPRNRVRHELLPHLRRRHNPSVVVALQRTAALLRDEDDYLTRDATAAAATLLQARDVDGVTLDAEGLRGYHIAVRRRVLHQYIQELAKSESVGFAAVEAVNHLLGPGVSGQRSIGAHIVAQCADGRLILRRGSPGPMQTELVAPGRTQVPGRRRALRARFLDGAQFLSIRSHLGGWRVAFDAAAAEDSRLVLRSPRPGDRLQPLGMGGRHKKLSDCFIDAKWPRILRGEALVLIRRRRDDAQAAEEILWVAGLTRSESYRVAPSSERILYLEFVDCESDGRA